MLLFDFFWYPVFYLKIDREEKLQSDTNVMKCEWKNYMDHITDQRYIQMPGQNFINYENGVNIYESIAL